MGTLSGGGKEVISIGERCLLGANAGIGISLGDDCVVEAGCYVTAGTKVHRARHATASPRSSRPPSCPAPTTCCSAATPSPAPSRPSRGRRRASRSTPPCMPTTELTTRSGEHATHAPAEVAAAVRRSLTWALVVLAACASSRGRLPGPVGRRAAARPRGLHRQGRRGRGRARHGAGRERHADRRGRRTPRAARAGGVDRAGHRVPGVASSRNLDHGDRDSVGLFQQRPSQGWGTRRAAHGPLLRDQRVLRRAGQDRRLPGDADHRGRPGGAALRLPRGLRGARRRSPRARVGADRLQRGEGSAASSTSRTSTSSEQARQRADPAGRAGPRSLRARPSATWRSAASHPAG